MNKIKILAMLAMAVFMMGTICACGDDDDEGETLEPAKLTGRWLGSNDSWNYWFTFNSDGTGIGKGHSKQGDIYQCEFTYTCSGNTIKCNGRRSKVSGNNYDYDDNTSWEFTQSGSILNGMEGAIFKKQGDDNNALISSYLGFGIWACGGMKIFFAFNGTGQITNSRNETKLPNGSFEFGNPYKIETKEDEIMFFIDATFTSGDYKGKTINWEVVCPLDIKNGDWIIVEGTEFTWK